MIECPVNHPALAGLFDPQVPNHPALWAVLQSRHMGRAFVDVLPDPSQCVLHTDTVMTYTSHDARSDFITEVVNNLKQSLPIWLIRPKDAPSAPGGYRCQSRLEFFDYDPASSLLAGYRASLPVGFEIRQIDMALLQHCEWRDDMQFFCGSLDNFLRNSLGLCMLQGDEIIVEAYASALGNGFAEIGAITRQPFRGKGYAPIAVAFLIGALEARGYHSYWSCDVDNIASARVARKLGFRIEKPYEIWEYEPGTG